MDSDLDNQDNHVPPISRGDDWVDLDEVDEGSRMSLPPSKGDFVLPPKRESRMSQEKRHAPLLKREQESEYNPLKPRADATIGKRKKDEAKQAPKSPVKSSRNAPAKAAKKSQGKKSSPDSVPEATEESKEELTTLPPARSPKRLRVKEIDPSSESPPERPEWKAFNLPKLTATATVDGQNEALPVALNRRRFSQGERADWGDNAGQGQLWWMILTGLAVVVLVVLAVVLSQLSDGDGKRREDQSFYSQLTHAEDKLRDDSEDLKSLEFLTNSQQEAKSIFAAYACAKSPDEFIGFTYASERNRKLIESEWKPLGMEPGWVPGDNSIWSVLERDGVSYAILEGVLSDFTKFSGYFRQEDGVLKIDWKATVGYDSEDFAVLKTGKGDGSEIRAWISMSDFYTFSFPEGKYRCYKIVSAKREMNLWGYVAEGSELHEEFQKLFLPSPITGESQSKIQVILRLGAGHGDSLPDQWMIVGILRLSWLDE